MMTLHLENKKRYQNYLFDLYGTLVDIHTDEDSEDFWQSFQAYLTSLGARWTAEAAREFYRRRVRELEALASRQLPGGIPEIDLAPIFREFLQGCDDSEAAVAKAAARFRMLSMRKLRLFEGAKETLLTLRSSGRGVYLLSNAQHLFTMEELEALGLRECFDGILLSSDAGRKKPDPEFFRMLLNRFHLDPSETLMVGNDDEADCRGAAAAGLNSLYLRTEQSPEPKYPLPEGCLEIPNISAVTQTL